MFSDFWALMKSAMPEALGAILATIILTLLAIFWKHLHKSWASVRDSLNEVTKSMVDDQKQPGDTTARVAGIKIGKPLESSQRIELGKVESGSFTFKLFDSDSRIKTNVEVQGSSASASTKGDEAEASDPNFGHARAGRTSTQSKQHDDDNRPEPHP